MEFNKINFKVIEDCFKQAESRELLYNIFIASSQNMTDSEVKVLKPDSLPGLLRQLPSQLEITNEKAVMLILSLHALMKEYIAVGMQDEESLASRFPSTFNKKIMSFMFKTMRSCAEDCKQYYQDQFTNLPRMVDFDWRLDVKISSKSAERLKQPILYVKMDLEDAAAASGEQNKEVLF